ncbi:Com family DNA-binding transcriptional regulator [Chrysiogenes arsenatis]|uniref:Com family DNA-binding transcriptional regulator n=1 Tax=Chrysiogenes arsenatis TaxID=309797 RepID=UPI0003F7D63C
MSEKNFPLTSSGNGSDLEFPDEIRCRKCRRLLMKGHVLQIEVKCPKCGALQRFESDNDKELPHCIHAQKP